MAYNKGDHPMYEYLNNFVAARITKALASLGELALVINSIGRVCLLLCF